MKLDFRGYRTTRWVCGICCAVLAIVSAVPCFGAGYGIYEWGVRGNALGGAMVARADDPSAVAYNPAGITQLDGSRFMMGMTMITPAMDINFKDGSKGLNGNSADNTWAIPNVFYTRQLSDRYWMGVGIYSRVGLGTEVENPDQFAGRYNCSLAGVESVSFNPNLAVKLTDELSVAVGIEAIWLDFSYDKYTDIDGNPATDTDVKQQVRADGWKYGFNLAMHFRPKDWLALGLSFRNEIQLGVDGQAKFSWSPGAEAALAAMKNPLNPPAVVGMANYLDAALRDTNVSGTEPVPQLVALGVMFKPLDRLSVEIDAVRTKWSSYNKLTFEYDNILGDKASVKNWKDAWRFQIGLEYELLDWLDLFAGYVFDESPIQDGYVDYAVPANDRQIYTLGTGLRLERWAFDFSYGYLVVKNRDVTGRPAEGVYDCTFEDGRSHLFGFSASCRF